MVLLMLNLLILTIIYTCQRHSNSNVTFYRKDWWKLSIHPRLKMLGWRLFHNILPTVDELFRNVLYRIHMHVKGKRTNFMFIVLLAVESILSWRNSCRFWGKLL